MQIDHALYLKSNNINQEGVDTQYQLGNTCSRRKTNMVSNSLSASHSESLHTFFSDAIANEWLLVLIVDDFTKIHTNRRPNDQKVSDCMSMCTIVVKAFKSVKAIKLPKNLFNLHDPLGINIDTCVHKITSPRSMSLLRNTYASVMAYWLTKTFFSPELQRL